MNHGSCSFQKWVLVFDHLSRPLLLLVCSQRLAVATCCSTEGRHVSWAVFPTRQPSPSRLELLSTPKPCKHQTNSANTKQGSVCTYTSYCSGVTSHIRTIHKHISKRNDVRNGWKADQREEVEVREVTKAKKEAANFRTHQQLCLRIWKFLLLHAMRQYHPPCRSPVLFPLNFFSIWTKGM